MNRSAGAASVASAHHDQKGEHMSVYSVNECGYCGCSIVEGQRWVREKIFNPASQSGGESKYRRYHAEIFAADELSCWEKHLLQVELARATPRAA